jgi:DNA-binding CsgD family transcriptional regulator
MHLDEKSINDLIGAIYDGVGDPALWQHALVRLSDATHSVSALLVARDRVNPEQSRYVLAGCDPDLFQLFLARYAKDCPWTRVADRAPTGNVFAVDAAVPARELIKTEFYAEILRPQQVLHEGVAILARDASRFVGLSVFRSAKIGHVGSEDLRLLSLVAPHFKRAAQMAWRLATHAAVDAAKSVALDHLDAGVVLLDARGRVLFANRAAEAIFALRDGLTVVREGLRAAWTADTARLQILIAETLRGSAGGTMRVMRPSLAEPFLLLVAPARGNWYWSIDPTPAVVVFITALDQAVVPDLRLLGPAFDLTTTEAKVAVSIAAGGGVPATARTLRISSNTVHTHLLRIFRKLGVNDQPGLVRVLMRAIAVLPADNRDPKQAADALAKPTTPGMRTSLKTAEPHSSPHHPIR